MADDKIPPSSGAADPYARLNYTPGANKLNTLTVESFIKLLAAQLQNQDMTNPMDNSEMMAQMTQMAMVQSIGAMTETMNTSMIIDTQTYAAGLVGQEVTMAVFPEGAEKPTGVKYGKIVSVDLTGQTPILRLENDSEDYPLAFVLGLGHINDPYVEDEDGGGDGDDSGTDPNTRDVHSPTKVSATF